MSSRRTLVLQFAEAEDARPPVLSSLYSSLPSLLPSPMSEESEAEWRLRPRRATSLVGLARQLMVWMHPFQWHALTAPRSEALAVAMVCQHLAAVDSLTSSGVALLAIHHCVLPRGVLPSMLTGHVAACLLLAAEPFVQPAASTVPPHLRNSNIGLRQSRSAYCAVRL